MHLLELLFNARQPRILIEYDGSKRRNDAAARQRYLVRELEKLGNTVTLHPAA